VYAPQKKNDLSVKYKCYINETTIIRWHDGARSVFNTVLPQLCCLKRGKFKNFERRHVVRGKISRYDLSLELALAEVSGAQYYRLSNQDILPSWFWGEK
jgi:hypothetical protein